MKDCRFKDDSHTKCWCSIAKLDYQRVTEIPSNKNIQFMTRTSTCCGVHEEVEHVYVVVISIYYRKSQKLWLWWNNHNFWGICLNCFVFLVVVVAVAVDVAVTLAVAAAAVAAAAVAAVLVAESPIVLFSSPPSTICFLVLEAEGKWHKRFHVLRSKKKRTRMGGAFIRCKSNQLQF